MKYLLDTNICIGFLKGDKEIVSKFKTLEPSEIKLSSIVKAELLYGARKSARIDENLRLLDQFFSQFESFHFDDLSAHYYGLNRALLARAGSLIGPHDLMIASIAQAHDIVVVTRNLREFHRIPGLRIEEW